MTTLTAPGRDDLVKGGRTVSAQGWDADDAVTHLYAAHYQSLVRMAALLVRQSGEAEEIVQDSFVAMHGKWRRLREPEKALGYLRQSVVNRARSAHRHHKVADKHLPRLVEPSASVEDHALHLETRTAILAALHELPTRQREVLVLRYYSDLSEAEIAGTLGISRGAVKSHASRGMSSLRHSLEDQE